MRCDTFNGQLDPSTTAPKKKKSPPKRGLFSLETKGRLAVLLTLTALLTLATLLVLVAVALLLLAGLLTLLALLMLALLILILLTLVLILLSHVYLRVPLPMRLQSTAQL